MEILFNDYRFFVIYRCLLFGSKVFNKIFGISQDEKLKGVCSSIFFFFESLLSFWFFFFCKFIYRYKDYFPFQIRFFEVSKYTGYRDYQDLYFKILIHSFVYCKFKNNDCYLYKYFLDVKKIFGDKSLWNIEFHKVYFFDSISMAIS